MLGVNRRLTIEIMELCAKCFKPARFGGEKDVLEGDVKWYCVNHIPKKRVLPPTTHENNLLIAEFMHSHPMKKEWGMPDYHADWNQLMPVIYQIELLGYSVELKRDTANIWNDDNVEIIDIEGPSRITTAYIAVLAFIQMHNK